MKKSVQFSSSKYQIRYTEEFKRHVCHEYLEGQISKSALAKKYAIGGGSTRITLWLRAGGYDEVPRDSASMFWSHDLKEETAVQANRTSLELESEIKQLKKALEDQRLQTERYSKMIDIAEKEWGISIRKR